MATHPPPTAVAQPDSVTQMLVNSATVPEPDRRRDPAGGEVPPDAEERRG